jgi:predicted AAA+ superfamily ATPase
MVHRKIESVILEMLDIFRIVAINGPRQSGKTTLQKKIAKLRNMKYYTFDDPDIFNTASNDPMGFISYIAKEDVAIDEVQSAAEAILGRDLTDDDRTAIALDVERKGRGL